MAQNLAIRLAVENGQQVTAQLKQVGETGERAFSQVASGAQRASSEMEDMRVSSVGLGTAVNRLTSIFAGFLTLDLARHFVETGDAYVAMQSRLAIVSGGADQGALAYQKLFDIAQETRQPVAELSDLFSQIGLRAQDMGLTLEEKLSIVRLVGQSLATVKTSAIAASGAILQFGQMIGGAKVQAQEFNSIMDGLPGIAQAMAHGLGLTVGEMKTLIETGTLEPQRAIEALFSQASAIEQQFLGVARTVREAYIQFQNELFDIQGRALTEGGTAASLIDGLDRLKAAVSDPAFFQGVGSLSVEFARFFADLAEGFTTSVEQVQALKREIAVFPQDVAAAISDPIEYVKQEFELLGEYVADRNKALNETLRDVGETAVDTLPGVKMFLDIFREKAPEAAAALDSVADHVLGLSAEARKAAADAAKMYQNFAGASGFRAAQDAGFGEEYGPFIPVPDEFKTPGFKPKKLSEADRDAAWGRRLADEERAAREGERAREQAARAAEQKIRDDERFLQAAIQREAQELDAVAQLEDAYTQLTGTRIAGIELTLQRQLQANAREIEDVNHRAAADIAATKHAEEEKARLRKDTLDALQSEALAARAGALESKARDPRIKEEERTRAMEEGMALRIQMEREETTQRITELEKVGLADEDFARAREYIYSASMQRILDIEANTAKEREQGFIDAENLARDLTRTISSGLAEMVIAGREGFDSLGDAFQSFLDGMQRQLIQTGIEGLLGTPGRGGAGGSGLFGLLFGSFAASGGGGGSPGSIGGVPLATGTMLHTGSPGIPIRAPAELWRDAPRYHNGYKPPVLAPWERAAIIRKDETVLTPTQMAARDQPINITINNNSAEPVNARKDGRGDVQVDIGNVVASALSKPGSPARQAVRGLIQNEMRSGA